jgi:hypothetical protein
MSQQVGSARPMVRPGWLLRMLLVVGLLGVVAWVVVAGRYHEGVCDSEAEAWAQYNDAPPSEQVAYADVCASR